MLLLLELSEGFKWWSGLKTLIHTYLYYYYYYYYFLYFIVWVIVCFWRWGLKMLNHLNYKTHVNNYMLKPLWKELQYELPCVLKITSNSIHLFIWHIIWNEVKINKSEHYSNPAYTYSHTKIHTPTRPHRKLFQLPGLIGFYPARTIDDG